jgi:hypothetical protein
MVNRNEKGAISLSGNFFAGLCGGLMEAVLVVTPQVAQSFLVLRASQPMQQQQHL